MKNEKIGVLVGAAPLGAEKERIRPLLREENCISAAADGGLSFYVSEKICPDFWIGDADSFNKGQGIPDEIKTLFPGLVTEPCSPVKDDSDMWLGTEKLAEEGAEEIYIFGGLGGERLEHTIANIQLMYGFAKRGIRIVLIGEDTSLFVLCATKDTPPGRDLSSVRFDKTEEGYVSVFAIGGEAEVSIKGLFYEFDGIISPERPRGLSNEFSGKDGEISVRDGAVTVIRTKIIQTV